MNYVEEWVDSGARLTQMVREVPGKWMESNNIY